MSSRVMCLIRSFIQFLGVVGHGYSGVVRVEEVQRVLGGVVPRFSQR